MIDFEKRAEEFQEKHYTEFEEWSSDDLPKLIAAFGQECWNAAIEEAALKITETGDPPTPKVFLVAADVIRSLKLQEGK